MNEIFGKNYSSSYRFTRSEAIELLRDVSLGELMRMAYEDRSSRFNGRYVTFVFDTNPNYTNICITGCDFCAFHRKTTDKDAYVLSPEQVVSKVKYAETLGATTVLLQGGHNPSLTLNDYLSYIREIKKACPNMHIHPFSPSEFFFMAKREKTDVKNILYSFWKEGIRTLPGGGAEILVDRVRRIISKNKISSGEWLETCKVAHEIGFKSTATMMFGHVESDKDIIDHFLKLRSLQDLTEGFVSFIPWSFKLGNTLLAKKVGSQVNPTKYLRIIATARLVLDNFPHVQSSWFSESVDAGMLGLLAGADDFGGILVEENVHMHAGHSKSISLDDITIMIRKCGFIPAQRDSNYNILRVYN